MNGLLETEAVWEYDGTFWGFLNVVDRAFSRGELPAEILTPDNAAESLFSGEWIVTDIQRGRRIVLRLRQRLTLTNFEFIQNGFNATLLEKERLLLQVLAIALQTKDSLENFIGNPAVLAVNKAIRTLFGEVHLLTGFVRFEYVGDVLFSQISPKHQSLPYLCPHFAERYPYEKIMIYDETHRLLAVINQGETSFVEEVERPQFAENLDEAAIQGNWQKFLTAVTIKERINRQAQLNHLPLRYRKNMVDFKK